MLNIAILEGLVGGCSGKVPQRLAAAILVFWVTARRTGVQRWLELAVSQSGKIMNIHEIVSVQVDCAKPALLNGYKQKFV